MHTLHHIAVQAESPEQAFDAVKEALQSGQSFNDWSDWHVLGGGRWHSNGDYQYEDDPSDVICFKDNNEIFFKIVSDALLRRQGHLLELIQFMKENPESTLYRVRQKFMKTEVWPNPLIEKEEVDMSLYYLSRMTDLLVDRYSSESGIYDLTERTADVKWLRQRLLDEDICDKQYLVPVDFHF